MRYFIFLFCQLLTPLYAQQTLTGRITDATDEMPIPHANVFIANTSLGTYSDESGNYAITVPIEGSFEVFVSHVGYRTASMKVETPKSFHQINFVMQAHELMEVVVTAPTNYRQADVDLFWYRLLGEKPSKRGMEALNPENLRFYLGKDSVLKVSSRDLIEIVNHQMGYHIYYYLQSFEHDYRNNETTFYGAPYFEELVPQNARQMISWKKKRQDVYNVSVTRFIRALYREQIYENGFLLAKSDSVLYAQTPFPLKEILHKDSETTQVYIQYPLLLACLSKPVTNRMIKNTYNTIYERNNTFPIMTLLPQSFIIYPDGSYSGLLKMHVYRNPITVLKSMLPVEYTAE